MYKVGDKVYFIKAFNEYSEWYVGKVATIVDNTMTDSYHLLFEERHPKATKGLYEGEGRDLGYVESYRLKPFNDYKSNESALHLLKEEL